MTFAIDITFETGAPRLHVQQTLARLLEGGPFDLVGLDHASAQRWVLSLRQKSPALVANFTKAAELQLLLSKEFDLLAAARTDLDCTAVAS